MVCILSPWRTCTQAPSTRSNTWHSWRTLSSTITALNQVKPLTGSDHDARRQVMVGSLRDICINVDTSPLARLLSPPSLTSPSPTLHASVTSSAQKRKAAILGLEPRSSPIPKGKAPFHAGNPRIGAATIVEGLVLFFPGFQKATWWGRATTAPHHLKSDFEVYFGAFKLYESAFFGGW